MDTKERKQKTKNQRREKGKGIGTWKAARAGARSETESPWKLVERLFVMRMCMDSQFYYLPLLQPFQKAPLFRLLPFYYLFIYLFIYYFYYYYYYYYLVGGRKSFKIGSNSPRLNKWKSNFFLLSFFVGEKGFN